MEYLAYYPILAGLLFAIGLAIVTTQKNTIRILMGIELMLNASNINFIAFGSQDPQGQGQTMGLFVLLIAAAESVVAMAIIYLAFQHFRTNQMDQYKSVGE